MVFGGQLCVKSKNMKVREAQSLSPRSTEPRMGRRQLWCTKHTLKGEQEGKRIQVRQEETGVEGDSSERAPERQVTPPKQRKTAFAKVHRQEHSRSGWCHWREPVGKRQWIRQKGRWGQISEDVMSHWGDWTSVHRYFQLKSLQL